MATNPNSKYNPHNHRKEYNDHGKVSAAASYLNMFPAFNLAELTANWSKRTNTKVSPPHQTQIDPNPFNLSSVKNEERPLDPTESIAALIGLAGVLPPPAAPATINEPVQKTENVAEKPVLPNSWEFIQNLEHELTNNVNNNFGMKNEMGGQFNNGDVDEREDDSHFDYSGPVLTENCISFDIQVPNLLPNYLSMHYVCETGSRLLFSTVMWVKKNSLFQMLRLV